MDEKSPEQAETDDHPTSEGQQSASEGETTPEPPSKKSSDPAPAARRSILPGKRVVLPGAAYWFMELIVVFAGVFGAFMLAENRNRSKAREQREKISYALLAEVAWLTAVAREQIGPNVLEGLTAYDSSMQAGDPLPLRPITGGSVSALRPRLWETARASGALNLLDVETMIDYNNFYIHVGQAVEAVEHITSLSESMLLPNPDAPISEYYDPQTNELRRKYSWYLWDFRTILFNLRWIARQGDSLLVDQGPEALPDSGNLRAYVDSINVKPEPDWLKQADSLLADR